MAVGDVEAAEIVSTMADGVANRSPVPCVLATVLIASPAVATETTSVPHTTTILHTMVPSTTEYLRTLCGATDPQHNTNRRLPKAFRLESSLAAPTAVVTTRA